MYHVYAASEGRARDSIRGFKEMIAGSFAKERWSFRGILMNQFGNPVNGNEAASLDFTAE